MQQNVSFGDTTECVFWVTKECVCFLVIQQSVCVLGDATACMCF